jgi:hypothetical protein
VKEEEESEENCTVRSFVICCFHLVLLEGLNNEGCDGWVM